MILSAFVFTPSVKMDWLVFGGKIAATIAAKMALNAVVPGASADVDFCQGNVVGSIMSVASGLGDICMLGASGTVKAVMKESAKKAGVQTANELAREAEKEVTRKVGQELGK